MTLATTRVGYAYLASGWRSSSGLRRRRLGAQGRPLALSIFGNVSLDLRSATLVLGVIVRRRREWAGCQRLFWDVITVAMALWIVGQSAGPTTSFLSSRPG